MNSSKKYSDRITGPPNRAGGAATGGGMNFQAAVTAIAVVYMTRGVPVRWLSGVAHDLVIAVQAETGRGGDDIKLELIAGKQVEVQVKKGLRATSALWDALLQIAAAITVDDRTFGVLAVCPLASATIRRDLATDTARIGEGRTDQLTTIGRTWLEKLQQAELDAAFVCSRLRICTVAALVDDQAGVMAAKAELGHICRDTSQIETAWLTLYADSAQLIEQRGRRDRDSVERVLRAVPIDLRAIPPSVADPWQLRLGQSASEVSVLRILDGGPVNPRSAFLSPLATALLDEEAQRRANHIRKARHFEQFRVQAEARRLASDLLQNEFAACSPLVRAPILANCARWLSLKGEPEEVRLLLHASDTLANTEECIVAAAFFASRDDWKAALNMLAPIDTPLRRAAAFQIFVNGHSPAEALAWASAAGIGFSDLESDGRNVLISCLLLVQDWDGAFAVAVKLGAEDFAATPGLQPAAALSRLAQTIAPDLRFLVANGTPLDAASFRLADDADAMAERRIASELLRGAEASAREFENPELARAYATTALWLELRDPMTAVAAHAVLEAHLDRREEAIAFLPLATEFGVLIDTKAIEDELNRRLALEPSGSTEVAVARLVMAKTFEDPAQASNYLEQHREVLWQQLNKAGVLDIEVQLLIASGQLELARERLTDFGEVLEPSRRLRLETIVASEPDPRKDAEETYARDPSTLNLVRLVSELASDGFSERFFALARELVRATRTTVDAEMLVRFLLRHDRHDEVAIVLAEFPEVVATSPDLRSAQAWLLFREGSLEGALTILAGLRSERDEANDRNLLVNILITAGRWPELLPFVEQEWSAAASRSAHELLGAAQIAQQTGSPRYQDLLKAAAERGADDPNIFLGCYMLATRSGREDELDAHLWFERACALSDENGPVQQGSLEDISNASPDWDKQVETVWDKVRLGEIPISAAAKMLRRPSLELVLAPAIANREQTDPRRRSVISAFSGARGARGNRPQGPMAFDGSALITLGLLGRLPTVLNNCPDIVLPHSTLSWLFNERQELPFHQPSRIRAAHELLRLLNTNRLERFQHKRQIDDSLADDIGRSLAAMLGDASSREDDSARAYVVRSAPVAKVGSFRQHTVDLDFYLPVLRSCQAVLDKLADKALLTIAEERQARAYLERVEERWPGEPGIEDGSVLLLDDLSVSYLRTTGLLSKLHSAGLSAFVPDREFKDAEALLALESRSAAIEAVIETVRGALDERIRSGSVHLDRTFSDDELEAHPDIAVMQCAARAAIVVSDDRFMNQHGEVQHERTTAGIWTSLDLLDALCAEGLITEEELWADRTTLRQSGYAFVPTDQRELASFLALSRSNAGILVETAELRALRENLRLVQQRAWLVLPREDPWFSKLLSTIIACVRDQWRDNISDDDARARSRWLLRCVDLRNWSSALADRDPVHLAQFGQAVAIHSLLMNRVDINSDKAAERMDDWLENEVVADLKEDEPQIFEWLMQSIRAILLDRSGETIDAS